MRKKRAQETGDCRIRFRRRRSKGAVWSCKHKCAGAPSGKKDGIYRPISNRRALRFSKHLPRRGFLKVMRVKIACISDRVSSATEQERLIRECLGTILTRHLCLPRRCREAKIYCAPFSTISPSRVSYLCPGAICSMRARWNISCTADRARGGRLLALIMPS